MQAWVLTNPCKGISEEWDTPLAKEFGRVVSEMSMGQTRASALRNMAERLDVTEVSSFVAGNPAILRAWNGNCRCAARTSEPDAD